MSKSNRVSDNKAHLDCDNKFWFLYTIILIEACGIAWLMLPEFIK